MGDIIYIGSGVFVFTFIVSLLVMVILLARSKLVQLGEVSIMVNDDNSNVIKANGGGTLLTTLADNEIFVSSACGGGGTCAQCKVVVKDGGGDVLPTEEGLLSKKEIKEGCRLSCQVKVKKDLNIEVPAEVFSVKKVGMCSESLMNNVATFIKELVLELPEGESVDFKAGGFIQIEMSTPHKVDFKDFEVGNEYRDVWDDSNLLAI